MKSAIGLTLFLSSWTFVSSYVVDRHELEIMMNASRECSIHRPLDVLRNPHADPTALQEAKCSLGCFMRALNVITDSFTVNQSGIKHLRSMFHVDKPSIRCSKEEVKKTCAKVQGKDDCDFAGKLFSCFLEKCSFDKKHISVNTVN